MFLKATAAAVPLIAAAACGSAGATQSLSTAPRATGATSVSSASSASTTSPGQCGTSGLSMRLGSPGHAAGSTYVPIVFTNTSSSSCTMYGYPGVSYRSARAGHQVGAPASRNKQHAATTVTLAPDASASALLQIVDYANFPPDQCQDVAVAGLRVYPPGNTTASFVPLPAGQRACSTGVKQLSVEAVVAGTTGMG